MIHLNVIGRKQSKNSLSGSLVKERYIHIPYDLNFVLYSATTTTIDAGPDIYVGIGSKLVLTCRVYTAGIKLNYLIWRRGDKVKLN